MSQRGRLGLTDLSQLRRPLVQTAVPSAVPPEPLSETIEVPLVVPPAVPAAPPSEQPRILQQRKERKRLISQSFKLPEDLDQRWTQIAAFNQVTKTGILLEALETFLDRLPQPPIPGQPS